MRKNTNRWLVGGTVLSLIIYIAACSQNTSNVEEGNVELLTYPLDTGSLAAPNTYIALANFNLPEVLAWNTFFALSRPAIVPDSINGYHRGFPDVTKGFGDAAHDALSVWETYKEKREIFNQGTASAPTLSAWNSEVDYGPLTLITTNEDPAAPPVDGRVLLDVSKQQSYDGLDETAEVGSEALEATFPNGTANPVMGRPVGVRVWKGNPTDGQPVVYEVKLNYDYYNYVSVNELYKYDAFTSDSAFNGKIRFPYRTTSSEGPGGQGKDSVTTSHTIVLGYQQAAAEEYMRSNQTGSANPPLMGTMQLKAAWIKLGTNDNPANYHTSEASYYVTENGAVVAKQGTFGLIGLHIIQRIHTTDPTGEAEPPGGTYLFATWEHTSVRTDLYTYSNYYNPNTDPLGPTLGHTEGFYPPIDTAQANDGVYVVQPKYDILASTQKVNEAVWAMLPEGSVWKNYQLVGTQYYGADVADTTSQEGVPVTYYNNNSIPQTFYLANTVVETNQDLQFFQGQPPRTIPINHYQFKRNGDTLLNANTTFDYQRTNNNAVFAGKAVNMGGCMGCHGVAQSKGYAFSFVLLGGRAGAGTATQTNFDIPPLVPNPPTSTSGSGGK